MSTVERPDEKEPPSQLGANNARGRYTSAACTECAGIEIVKLSGMLPKIRGFVRENPDKGRAWSPVREETGSEEDSYRTAPSGSLSSVSGVNRPICTAKRITSLRFRSPSFSAKRERYVSIVFTPMKICLAICALV